MATAIAPWTQPLPLDAVAQTWLTRLMVVDDAAATAVVVVDGVVVVVIVYGDHRCILMIVHLLMLDLLQIESSIGGCHRCRICIGGASAAGRGGRHG